jgi:hypothetical protein
MVLSWPLWRRQEYLKIPAVQGRVEELKAELLRLHALRQAKP